MYNLKGSSTLKNIIFEEDKTTNNGGLTRTQVLRIDSLSIDAGNNVVCPATDQRGICRLIDGDGLAICDIGAYEYKLNTIYLPLIFR